MDESSGLPELDVGLVKDKGLVLGVYWSGVVQRRVSTTCGEVRLRFWPIVHLSASLKRAAPSPWVPVSSYQVESVGYVSVRSSLGSESLG